ncbi:M16 family metallopeptidase [Pedosphaera parvula]|uniref:Peptidase M16 domain protein n=1 Tax=Pedosphaera parvula (strain Ellin514) TaxID=320771 RepID=B9XB52_PEDPL|nr:pitrilysin family protein [Pedosphaera parvula]EEF62737.1 peptidase M16 domain protein [Pedosphaera parvula Ellin514]
MIKKTIIFSLLAACLALCLPSSRAVESVVDSKVEIPFKKFVLKNGLTVIVHEDHKAPIVAVNVWYHVGSKNEKTGKTGFAHLFEHLMFNGSEHFNDDYFQAMERIGATDMNGTTSEDRTDYFQNVPKNALDTALWMESDRMGHLVGVIDKPRLDEQRGVVQNEKRQNENQPYGVTEELLVKGTAPAGHPYSWTVIGSMDDLNAASLDDVKTWFKTYYGAANAVLVLAGDIDAETALKKAEQYFGDIPAGPPVAKFEKWVPKMGGTRRQVVSDRVPQARIYKVWNIPGYGEADTTYLDLASDVLASGKTSRLYKRLVYDDQLCTDVSVSVDPREICGQFGIIATAKPGGDLRQIEKAIDEEVARFLAKGPTEKELTRVKAANIAAFIRGAERIGGFGGKSDLLAMNQTYRGTPDFYKTINNYVRNATAHDVQDAAKRWLTDDVYILDVYPYPKHDTASSGADRTKLPTPGAPPEIKFPAFQRTKLSNGLNIILAERHSTPLVSFNMLVDAGSAADQFATPGTARLAMDMLDEGTTKRTALDISEELSTLGANLSSGSDLDTSTVHLSTLKSTLDRALDIYSDVILNPAFPEADFKRLQKQRIAGIQREKTEPTSMALRVFPGLLYGKSHAYANPMTGSGTEETVAKLTTADMHKFYNTWFKPNNATLIVVGDTTLNEIVPKLEKQFGTWKSASVPKKNLGNVEQQKKSVVYLIDRPGSIQSVIFAGHVAPPKNNPDEISIETMNNILGGAFTSRVNMNLREDKHWAYGAHTFMSAARGQRPFIAYAPVQSDKTSESMVEMEKELRGILGKRPITAEELEKAQKYLTLKLPGSWETNDRVAGSIGEIVRFGLPEDYFKTYPDNVRALNLDQVAKAAQEVVHPDQLVWVVVGDRSKVEPEIRSLGWGDIQLMDADGNPIK